MSAPPLPSQRDRAANKSLSGVTPERRSTHDAWTDLRETGVTAREWAQLHGFAPSLVYSVLSGTRKCFRGKSYQVAKALGIK